MFLRNNERIDTEILRDRVLLEINRLKRRTTDRLAAAAPLGKSGLASQETSQRVDTEANLAPAYMRFIHKISAWIWCFVHLPRIYTTVDSTKSRATSNKLKPLTSGYSSSSRCRLISKKGSPGISNKESPA